MKATGTVCSQCFQRCPHALQRHLENNAVKKVMIMATAKPIMAKPTIIKTGSKARLDKKLNTVAKMITTSKTTLLTPNAFQPFGIRTSVWAQLGQETGGGSSFHLWPQALQEFRARTALTSVPMTQIKPPSVGILTRSVSWTKSRCPCLCSI